MEQILNDTQDIYPKFWQEYLNSPDNHHLQNDFEQSNKEIENIPKVTIIYELSLLFDLLIYLTSSVENIYLDNCSSFMDILNTLCIHSSLSRELNFILVNEFKSKKTDIDVLNEIIEDFIDLTTIITDVLDTSKPNNSKENSLSSMVELPPELLNTNQSNTIKSANISEELFKRKVEESKVKAKNLYLKIIANI
jgi:hypothetical protein